MARTEAYKAFERALKMPSALIRQERDFASDPPEPAEQTTAGGMRGGAAVLMVAAFEAFLADVLGERIQEVAMHKPAVDFNKLPHDMQTTNVFSTLDTAMKGPRFQQKGKKVSRIPAIRNASVLVANDRLNPLAFTSPALNPSQAAVRQVMRRIGLQRIFDIARPRFEKKWGGPVADTFIGDKLDEIVRRRHRVAHRADALSISRAELKEGVRFLKILAEVLDIEMGFHIRKVCRIAR